MHLKYKVPFYLLLMIFMASCSPKIVKPTNAGNKPEEPKKVEEKPVKRFTKAEISLMVPLLLDGLNLKTANKAEIERRAMPIDFYQGFSLGLDSATNTGLNFNLNVVDTGDDESKIWSVYKNESFKNSDLIVGPVFPDGLKAITKYSIDNNALIVSPLAASQPADFKNPNLVSIVNNIDLHGHRIGEYIAKNFIPSNTIVVLINPKKTEDEQFAAPIRNYFKESKANFTLQEYASVYTFETKMVKGKQYAVVITSSDKAFVTPTIDKLYKLKNLKTEPYNINLFGHPNWVKQTYTVEKLQNLNTIISTSFKVNYKNSTTINFIKKYRAKYGFEPSEYAFKGYDIGYYFGNLLAKYGTGYRSYITKEKYTGLHNSFNFIYNDQFGYINTHVTLLKYKNFALNTIN
jgi:hypothetical protein